MVALSIQNLNLSSHQEMHHVDNNGVCSAVPGRKHVTLDIVGAVTGADQDELRDLLLLGKDELEIVVRRRPVRPQDIQSEVESAPWRVTPQKNAKQAKQAAHVPETVPDLEEQTTAYKEEFGAWG